MLVMTANAMFGKSMLPENSAMPDPYMTKYRINQFNVFKNNIQGYYPIFAGTFKMISYFLSKMV